MRNRIAEFYKEHKIVVVAFCTGAVVGTAVCFTLIKKGVDGMIVVSGDVFERDNGDPIMALQHKNGSSTVLSFNESK